jgi:hypothetical protein
LQAFLAEDVQRVISLRSFDETTTAERVCAEWKYATNGQLGFLGFSKQGATFTIHMGRNIETLLQRKQFGTTLAASSEAMVEALGGSCSDNLALDHDKATSLDFKIQCSLHFSAGLLVRNECKEIDFYPVEYYGLIS